MIPRTFRQQLMYRGVRPLRRFHCKGCGATINARTIENCADASRARRYRREGRFIAVRVMRMFIQMVAAMMDSWGGTWVSMHQLYEVIEYIAQSDPVEPTPTDENGTDENVTDEHGTNETSPDVTSTNDAPMASDDIPMAFDDSSTLIRDVLNQLENLRVVEVVDAEGDPDAADVSDQAEGSVPDLTTEATTSEDDIDLD
ncbi:hypothetical protein FRC09_001113 [Ceratobasidium sp. 395]|nr:hypothetical protein FRC09_001113 [Ceratobasidium sp. 395]